MSNEPKLIPCLMCEKCNLAFAVAIGPQALERAAGLADPIQMHCPFGNSHASYPKSSIRILQATQVREPQ
jgi:hypothetical protein